MIGDYHCYTAAHAADRNSIHQNNLHWENVQFLLMVCKSNIWILLILLLALSQLLHSCCSFPFKNWRVHWSFAGVGIPLPVLTSEKSSSSLSSKTLILINFRKVFKNNKVASFKILAIKHLENITLFSLSPSRKISFRCLFISAFCPAERLFELVLPSRDIPAEKIFAAACCSESASGQDELYQRHPFSVQVTRSLDCFPSLVCSLSVWNEQWGSLDDLR